MSKEFIERYANQKKRLKQYFEREKTGDQTLYMDQAKLLEPLINSQKETQNKIVTGQESLSNALVPLVQELQKRNDQVEALQGLPFYNTPEIEGVPQSTPKKDIYIDVDADLLNDTHTENLEYMKFPLPSQIKSENYNDILKRITKEKKGITHGIKKHEHHGEVEIDMSRYATLEVLRQKIKTLQKNYSEFDIKSGKGLRTHKLVKQKRGRGRPKTKPDLIVYSNPDDLAIKLKEYILAKEAGNTGLDNYINEMLDELLEKKCINKDGYDSIFKNIFGKSK